MYLNGILRLSQALLISTLGVSAEAQGQDAEDAGLFLANEALMPLFPYPELSDPDGSWHKGSLIRTDGSPEDGSAIDVRLANLPALADRQFQVIFNRVQSEKPTMPVHEPDGLIFMGPNGVTILAGDRLEAYPFSSRDGIGCFAATPLRAGACLSFVWVRGFDAPMLAYIHAGEAVAFAYTADSGIEFGEASSTTTNTTTPANTDQQVIGSLPGNESENDKEPGTVVGAQGAEDAEVNPDAHNRARTSIASKCVTPDLIDRNETVVIHGQPYRYGEGCVDFRNFRGRTIDVEVISSGGSQARLNLSNYLDTYRINRFTPVLNDDLVTLTGSLSEISEFSMSVTLAEDSQTITAGDIMKVEKSSPTVDEEAKSIDVSSAFEPHLEPLTGPFPISSLKEELVQAALDQSEAPSRFVSETHGPEMVASQYPDQAHTSPYLTGRCDPSTETCLDYENTRKFRVRGENWCNPPFVNFSIEKSSLFQSSSSASLIPEHGAEEANGWIIEPGLEDLHYFGYAAGDMCPGAYVATVDYFWTGFEYPLFRAIIYLGTANGPECYPNGTWSEECMIQFFDPTSNNDPATEIAEIAATYSSEASSGDVSPTDKETRLTTIEDFEREADRLLNLINEELKGSQTISRYVLKNCQWTSSEIGRGAACFLTPQDAPDLRSIYAPQIHIFSDAGVYRAFIGGFDAHYWPRSLTFSEVAIRNIETSRDFILAAAAAFHPGPQVAETTGDPAKDAAAQVFADNAPLLAATVAEANFPKVMLPPLDQAASILLWREESIEAMLTRQGLKDIYVDFQLTVGP